MGRWGKSLTDLPTRVGQHKNKVPEGFTLLHDTRGQPPWDRGHLALVEGGTPSIPDATATPEKAYSTEGSRTKGIYQKIPRTYIWFMLNNINANV